MQIQIGYLEECQGIVAATDQGFTIVSASPENAHQRIQSFLDECTRYYHNKTPQQLAEHLLKRQHGHWWVAPIPETQSPT